MVLRLSQSLLISSCFSIFVLGVGTRLQAGAAASDTVRLVGQPDPVKGEITKESVRGITVGSRTYALSQVVLEGIEYDPPAPEQLTRAEDDLRARDFARAHSGFRAVRDLAEVPSAPPAEKAGAKGGKKPAKAAPKAGAGGVRTIFLQHALWGEVRTFRDEGNEAGTAAAIEDLLKAFPDSRWLAEALVLKVKIAKASAASIVEAKKLAEAAGAGPDLADRIDLLEAKALLESGKKPEAQKKLVILSKSSVKEVADEANLALAQESLAKGDSGSIVQAKMMFNAVLRSSKNRAILCGAAQGLGDTQLKEMGAKETADGLRDCLESYLRAAVLYFPASGDAQEPHQTALLSGAKVAEKLMKYVAANEKKNVRAQEGYRNVARDLYREIENVYPRSEAAKQARAAIGRLAAGAAQ
jgi:hypothetical protein